MDELKKRESQELSKEEINVYATDCGEIQNHRSGIMYSGSIAFAHDIISDFATLHLHIRIVRTEHSADKHGRFIILDNAISKFHFRTKHIHTSRITCVEKFPIQFIGSG